MESTSLPGRIQISRTTYQRVYDIGFDFEQRSVEVKGKGVCETYLLKDKHHAKTLVTYEELNQLLTEPPPPPTQVLGTLQQGEIDVTPPVVNVHI